MSTNFWCLLYGPTDDDRGMYMLYCEDICGERLAVWNHYPDKEQVTVALVNHKCPGDTADD